MKIRPVTAEPFHAARQTDRHEEVIPRSRFSQFLGARLKKEHSQSLQNGRH